MKKKTIIELVILGVLLSLVAVVAIVAFINKNDDMDGYEAITNGVYEVTLWIDEEDEEEYREEIGSILSTGEAVTHSFCNGYGVVRYNDTTYIIDTDGKIFASFHKDAEWGDILYGASDWNFYDGRAVFISEYGTLAFPIDYDGTGEYYWYKSAETEVLGVTEKNLLLVRETVQTPEGTTIKLGVQDDYGNWVINAKSTDMLSFSSEDRVVYLGENEFLLDCSSVVAGWYYSFNALTGAFESLGRKYSPKVYYKENFAYKDQIVQVSPISEGIQVLTIKNSSGVHFAVAVDENGNQIYEPIQIIGYYYGSDAGSYSEGLLGLEISEKNTDYTIYIDKNGNECARIPGTSCSDCHSGIISDGHHYYDKTGKLLFE